MEKWGYIVYMKMNKKKALAIIRQLRLDVITLGTDPTMEWEVDSMLDDAESRPASFFKTDEAIETFVPILDRMQGEGKLSNV
mgnify:CR=1 FL=1